MPYQAEILIGIIIAGFLIGLHAAVSRIISSYRALICKFDALLASQDKISYDLRSATAVGSAVSVNLTALTETIQKASPDLAKMAAFSAGSIRIAEAQIHSVKQLEEAAVNFRDCLLSLMDPDGIHRSAGPDSRKSPKMPDFSPYDADRAHQFGEIEQLVRSGMPRDQAENSVHDQDMYSALDEIRRGVV